MSDNKYIRFEEYLVLDHDSKSKLLHVDSATNVRLDQMARKMESGGTLTKDQRVLKHVFPAAFFQLKTLELNL